MGEFHFGEPVGQRNPAECEVRLQRDFQQKPQLSTERFAQAIAFDAVGHQFQMDQLFDLLGCILEIEMLQEVMQEDACPKAALKSREVVSPSRDVDRRFDWFNGVAIRFFWCFFGASGSQSGETSDHLRAGYRAGKRPRRELTDAWRP